MKMTMPFIAVVLASNVAFAYEDDERSMEEIVLESCQQSGDCEYGKAPSYDELTDHYLGNEEDEENDY